MNRNPISEIWRDKGYGPLTFGFDIGMASVGWAVLSKTRIIALGVRAFDKAEDEKGKPLNEHKRLMRTQRNRLKRRVMRLKKLRRLLRDAGLVPSADLQNFESTTRQQRSVALTDPWQLRAEGLDRRLEPGEWARVLYHIVKRRGFFAARKSETVDETKEGGKLTQGVKRTAALLGPEEKPTYRTLGEMAAKDEAFASTKRNKGGSYINSFARKLLGDELRQLFEQQRDLENPNAPAKLQAEVEALFWYQKPAITGLAMLNMIGRCTFEPSEYRAPKRSYSAERFVWLSKLNNIRILQNGERRALTPLERDAAKDLPYKNVKITYKQLRKAIGLADVKEAGFAGLSYRPALNKKGEAKDPEDATLIELKAWHETKRALLTSNLTSSWERISGDHVTLDGIALALSIYKSDEEIRPELEKLRLSEKEIEALLALDFKDFIQISLKAIAKLLPHLEQGMRYDEACSVASYNHAQPDTTGAGAITLPRIEYKDVRNPVVFRALNQARKVLNELVRVYGSPCAVHIELARDLSKSFEDRMDIRRGQEIYREEREAAIQRFREDLQREPNPKGQDVQKYRLYSEQGGKCAYSLQPIDIARLTEQGYVEIDHILPYSRSFDDSQNNKVLILTAENRNKGNRTPFEYLDGANESEHWRQFEAWARGQKSFRKAKRERLLRRVFDEQAETDFKARNLNDTRYITRFFSEFVRQNLRFSPDESGQIKKVPVLCPAGGFTSFLRARWGLIKNREASDLHHALDACVIAAASHSLIKRVSDFSRRGELTQLPNGNFADAQTGEILNAEQTNALGEHFPKPWPDFREEVLARLSPEPLRAIGAAFPAYDTAAREALKPVLVSRAVKRRAGGAVHQDTVRSVASHLGPQTSSKRAPLQSLKLSDLENIVGAHDGRNTALIEELRKRLEAHKGDGKKAFAQPVYKPRRDGTPGPVVRAVQVTSVQKGGVPVRGGVADQASMWRVDVFHKNGKHYLVPIYQADRRHGNAISCWACVAYKPREEWEEMNASFDFKFSLHPNDLVILKTRKATYRGYFVGMDVSTAAISINSHDRDAAIGKDGQWRSIGIKVGVESFEKFHVDVIGNHYPAKMEKRNGLA
ncbi:MAG: type II CRISPR RNA-guided endonuclease Cas9 [Polaromonas sp.]|uniref:type II CRISPR RNA-guided endonuclease Cas9 n=1 Tax=Polaromonas sp. TaxID=1869339 RepID=UPI0027375D12|nr:type II CRISPR RNA-guided endonuclease Cas9 [Polaromonas sp.]MDP3796794.1 type II CRISPR RNA-guided endonuclease Cas9 [Polaromonas sp.]